MSVLWQRARALIANKSLLLGALAIVPLATAARTAEAGPTAAPYTFSSGTAFIPGTSGETITTLGSTPGNPLQLFTNSPISASYSTYTSDLGTYVGLKWTGTVNNSFFPVGTSTIHVDYDFTLGVSQNGSGGTLTWALGDNIGGVTLDASSNTPYGGAGQEYTGSLSAPVTATLGTTWSAELDVFWSPVSFPCSLSINVPGNATIDLGVTNVPEPASLSLLGLGAVGLMVRRRRQVR